MSKNTYLWKLAGFIFTSITGVLLHYLYDWSGQQPAVGLFSDVNESTWEHMKLLFFPMVIFTAIESHALSDQYENYWTSKLFGIIYGLALIPLLYYTVTGIFGVTPGWVNIAIFFLAVLGAYWLELQRLNHSNKAYPRGFVLLVMAVIALAFFIFTFYPPHLPIFQDPLTGKYGICKRLI